MVEATRGKRKDLEKRHLSQIKDSIEEGLLEYTIATNEMYLSEIERA
jgi:hypothetical protein